MNIHFLKIKQINLSNARKTHSTRQKYELLQTIMIKEQLEISTKKYEMKRRGSRNMGIRTDPIFRTCGFRKDRS